MPSAKVQDRLGIENRITTLEGNYKDLKGDIVEIRDNHLAHLDKKVDKIHWLLVTTLITGIVTLLSKWLN